MLKCQRGTEYHHMRYSHTVAIVLGPKSRFATTPTITLAILTLFLLFNLIASPVKAESLSQSKPIRIGITPVILNEKTQFLHEWATYLEAHLAQPVAFVQQDSYGKITTPLLKGELDFAWICGYPYVQHQRLLDLIAIPLYKGKPRYQSYLIVSNLDIKTHSLLDLKDTVFAYSDPNSNSGYLYAQYSLKKANKNPESFFKQTFFTWQHKNTVEAVAIGLAQAGIIDGYIWETMKKQHHPLIAKTRVAHKSVTFAFPPVVASNNVASHLRNKLQHVLLSMDKETQGRRLLKQLNIEGFTPGTAQLFDDILKMHLFIENRELKTENREHVAP